MRAVNLLPEQHRRRPAGTHAPKGSAYVVLGVLGVLLVMAAVYTLTSNQVKDRTTQAEEARQEADGYEARVQALGAYGNFRQTKETRLASVRDLAKNRFDWERLMRPGGRIPDRQHRARQAGGQPEGLRPVAAGGRQADGEAA